MSVLDITAFLRARWDAEEAIAREAATRAASWPLTGTWHLEGVEHSVVGDGEAYCHPHNAAHISLHDPARVLREIEAKRRIVDTYAELDAHPNRLTYAFAQQQWVALRAVIAALALPYDDHEDYREEWRLS